ncbi:Gp15 family bacteriophage protein [Microbulbifer pacificus]|uniref:Gp15 family bacteriophage protein n=1 Tax=Microbulbifer pacificus TaxID=407164 RepID=UPI000CF51BBA|nr:Gp15 family bacteriophage protein [Microbulbifer pacificus]
MRLNDPLITSFSYNDQEYGVDLSFDTVLNAFDVLEDKRLLDHEKAEICLELLLDETFQGNEAIELWNYVFKEFIEIEQKKPIERDLEGNIMPSRDEDEGNEKRFIDLEKDAEHIYSSFRQAYGINLFEQQGKLHWKEFQSLLNGLPSDTIIQRIIQIRMWEPSKGESTEYKEEMKKLQRIHAIDDLEEVE